MLQNLLLRFTALVSLRISRPFSFLLQNQEVTASSSEEDKEDVQEAATRLAASRQISMNASLVDLLSEPDGICALKKNKKNSTQGFFPWTRCFCVPDSRWCLNVLAALCLLCFPVVFWVSCVKKKVWYFLLCSVFKPSPACLSCISIYATSVPLVNFEDSPPLWLLRDFEKF